MKGPPRVGILNPRLNQNTTMPTSRMPTPIHKTGLSSGLFWEEGSAAGRHHAPAGPGGERLDRLPRGPRPRGFSTAIAVNTPGGNRAGAALTAGGSQDSPPACSRLASWLSPQAGCGTSPIVLMVGTVALERTTPAPEATPSSSVPLEGP